MENKQRWDFLKEESVNSDKFFKEYIVGIPASFKLLQKHYNIDFYSTDFEKMSKEDNSKWASYINNIAGFAEYKDGVINIHYDSNLESEEQRMVCASILGNIERCKRNNKNIEIIKLRDEIKKCDYPFDGMNEEEFAYVIDNKFAREILMPKNEFEYDYQIFSLITNEGITKVFECLAARYCVPIKEVENRFNELNMFKKYKDNLKLSDKIILTFK